MNFKVRPPKPFKTERWERGSKLLKPSLKMFECVGVTAWDFCGFEVFKTVGTFEIIQNSLGISVEIV